ncbi:hypothetical protein BDR07DRAFT_1241569, partial [Suillus spraguei]
TKGGDGLNFNRTFWNQVAEHLAPFTTSGGVKTGDACSTKWTRLRTAYSIVDRVAHYSGISWSAERGADITFESEGVWANIIKNIPTAKPYRNKGWPLYEYLAEFM